MSTNRNLLTSPVGSIQFMAANTAIKTGKKDKNGKEVYAYTIKLALDNKKDKEYLSKVSEINHALVVTEQTYRGTPKAKSYEATKALLATGKSLVSASSQFAPEIYDSRGNKLEEAPLFFGDSVGTAQMIVQPWKGDTGGTIKLVGIIIHSVENAEGNGTATSDRESRLAQLRAVVAAAIK